LVAGSLCLVRFHQENRMRFLAAGFFLFGLALWDKFLFAWIFSGILVASGLILPRELRRHAAARNLAVATFTFCLGAAPLIFYNASFPLRTLRANTAYTAGDVRGKSHLLLSTLSGGGLFGYIPRDNAAGQPRYPRTLLERASVRLSDLTGARQAGFLSYAALASLLLLPVLW